MFTYTTTILVQVLSVCRLGALHAATGVAISLIVAILLLCTAALLPLGVHLAAFGRMQGHGVAMGTLVVGLHHVDLSVLGPVGWIGEP